MQNLMPELNRLFQMLEYAEYVVVFFDEIDELVRNRFSNDEEASSRFLTTAMLPKIVSLRRSRRTLSSSRPTTLKCSMLNLAVLDDST